MIKEGFLIDSSYIRQLNGAKSSNKGWAFSTEAATDDINGNIATETNVISDERFDEENYVEIFNNDEATPEQLESLVNGQTRFAANLYDFNLREVIQNVLMKFDTAIYDSEIRPKTPSIQLTFDDREIDYAIKFQLVIADKIGVDCNGIEAYIGTGEKQCCFYALAKTKTGAINTQSYKYYKNEKLTNAYGYNIEEDRYMRETDNFLTSKYIRIRRNAGATSTVKITQRSEKIDNFYVYDVKFKVGGRNYTTEDINTSEANYNAWYALATSEHAGEMNSDENMEAIKAAWEKCEGIKFKFFDVAGNETYYVMPYTELIVIDDFIELLSKLKRLVLDFINTTPKDLQLGTDLEGKTTILARNPNYELCDYDLFPIRIGLKQDSIGTIYPETYNYVLLPKQGSLRRDNFICYATELVDNINTSGYVKAFAYIETEFEDDLAFINDALKTYTYVEGNLGEFIKECNDNNRKINLEIFVPEYIKETSYDEFVLFLEKYLNTMYKAMDKDCYISILEKIARISYFNSPSQMETPIFNYFDHDHGDMIWINKDEIQKLINVEREELPTDET